MLDGREMGLPQISARPGAGHPAQPRSIELAAAARRRARPSDSAYRLDIAFDLSLPLPPQLEAAKFRLVSRAAELRRAGHVVPLSVASQHAAWTRLLRVLDARAAGASVADLCESGLCEDEAHCARLLAEARTLTQAGYLDILRVAG